MPLTYLDTHQCSIDYCYHTVPHEHAIGKFHNNVSNWPRGKVLGGSSCINAFQLVMGNQNEFEIWENNYGCNNFSYEHMFKAFKESEC
jgi:choline dehydrogenase-like flavoprotein